MNAQPDATPSAGAQIQWLTAWDLKQHEYCPRVLFYALCVPVKRYVPPKVVIGAEVHALVERLERRRSVRRFGFGRARKLFEVRCRSDRLALTGTVDMVLDDGQRVAPVELKMSELGVRPNIRMQLAAYALMLEETLRKPALHGFLVQIPQARVHRVEVTADDRAAVERRVTQIRRMLDSQVLPPPTADRGKCPDCELLPYCGDVG